MTHRPHIAAVLEAAQSFHDTFGASAICTLVPLHGFPVNLTRLATELREVVDRHDTFERMAGTLAHELAEARLALLDAKPVPAVRPPVWREVVFSDGFTHRVRAGVHEYYNTVLAEWLVLDSVRNDDAEHFLALREHPGAERPDVMRAILDELEAVVEHTECGSPESVRAMMLESVTTIHGFLLDAA